MLTQALIITLAAAALVTGQKPKTVVLGGEDGGRLDGSSWTSESIKDKVYAVFYVDPDEKDVNEKLEVALKQENFPKASYGSIAIINMEATWLPNAAIASGLKAKQEQYPDTIYVKDLKKVLVQQWGLKDDAYNTMVFDKSGKALFSRDGALSKADTQLMIDTIKTALAAP